MGNKEKESLGVRLAEVSKKVDIVQMAAGVPIFLFFSPAVGGVIIAGSAITYFAANEYQKRRRQEKAALPA